MQRIKIDQDIHSMSEFRTGIASFLKRVRKTKRPLIITQRGKGAAVLLDVAEYEAMIEKIELLQDIQTSISQIENGEGVSQDRAKEMISEKIGQ
jgi:antitoxin YefM